MLLPWLFTPKNAPPSEVIPDLFFLERLKIPLPVAPPEPPEPRRRRLKAQAEGDGSAFHPRPGMGGMLDK